MKKLLHYLLPYILIPIYAFILLLAAEGIYRGFSGVLAWARTEYHEFILVYIFMLSFIFMFHIFKRKIFLSFTLLFSLAVIVLSTINRVKMTLRGDPLIPADMLLISEARTMLGFLSDIPTWQIIAIPLLAIALLFAVVYGIYKMPKDRSWGWHRIVIGAAAAALIGYIYYQEVERPYSDIRAEYGIKTIDYNQKTNYELNGFVMAFTRNIKWLSIDPPSGYNEEAIAEITKDYSKEPYEVDGKKPHIVMIMSEAFWDPTRIENAAFNKDPMPNFHALASEHTSGNILAPVFGGSTANTEFEALTGYSMNFLPSGSIPYQFYMKKPMQSLPRMLKEQGYDTTAIHSYYNWFYQRNVVYENLGFDQFVSLEFIPEPTVDYMYYRDREVNDMIINQISNAEEPNFIFAVTMQNHGPYRDNLKKDYAQIEVEMKESDGKFTESSKNILEFYSDNIVQVDLELQRMIEELEKLDEDVMVVYFGDHLPLLGLGDQVYKESNYFLNTGSYEEYLKKYSTPLLVWDNFSEEREELNISPSYLPAYILQKSGLEGTSLTNMLNGALESGHGLFPREDFLDETNFSDELYKDYQLLQYDAMFGNKFDATLAVEPTDNFRLGMHDPVIKQTKITQLDGKPSILIEGDYFTHATKAFLDGNMLETVYAEGKLKAVLPDEKATGTLQVKVLDTYDRVLAKSNEMKLEK